MQITRGCKIGLKSPWLKFKKKKEKNWIATLQKNQIGLVSHTIHRDKLKCTKDLKVTSETIAFLEKKIERGSLILFLTVYP